MTVNFLLLKMIKKQTHTRSHFPDAHKLNFMCQFDTETNITE
jgi:hypothetical protein